MSTLRPQHQAFVDQYLVDLNGTAAAIRAGYAPKAAAVKASKLLARPDVQSALQAALEQRSAKVRASAEMVLEELVRLAKVDVEALFNPDGSLKPINEIPEDARRAIAGIEIVEEFEGRGKDRKQIGWAKKVKLWDKNKSLELIGRHLKMFTDVVEHKGLEGLGERLDAARKRSGR